MWVEDDEFFGSLIVKKLAERGCTLVYTPTGEEAVRTIEKEMPDLLILDVLLPGIDGFAVLEKIKSNELIKHIPVIIFSNMDEKSYMDRGKELGAERYFIKTELNLSTMVDEIEAVLKAHSSELG